MSESDPSDESAEEASTPIANQQRPDPWPVAKVIYEIGCGRYQYWIFCTTGIIWAADAMEMMLLGFLLPVLRTEWNLSGTQSSWVGVAVFVGMLFGATTLAVLSDKFGRKKVIIIGNLCTAVFGVLSGIAPNLAWMIVFRFGVGFFMTTGCVAFTLFAEFIPRGGDCPASCGDLTNPNRPAGLISSGKAMIIQGIFWSVGALFSVFLAWLTLSYLTWRWYLILSSVPLWFAFVGTLCLPESPHYLVVAGRYDEAVDLLNSIAQCNGVELPYGWTLAPNVKLERGRIRDLFAVQRRDTTILLYVMYSCCVFVYYGISFISVRYFEELDRIYGARFGVYWEMAITTSAEFPAILLGLCLIDRIGRRGVMNVAFFCFAASCYMLIIHSLQMMRIVGVGMVFMARMWVNLGFMGLGIYFVEFYPTFIRTTALGFAQSLGRVAAMVTVFGAESMNITLGLYLYGCAGLTAFITSILIAKDTQNRPLKEK